MTKTLKDKVIFITGASRGIGKAIALRAAREGAKVVVAAKTTEPHAQLEGTIFTAAQEIENAGGSALAVAVDVRDENMVMAAVEKTMATFGGIDVLVNNASAINLGSTVALPMKRFDLMMSVNMRATYMCAKYCIPALSKAANPHIINLSPPLNMNAKWFKNNLAYSMSKYGMSMCTLGLAAELKEAGIAVNSLWPKTVIATAAIAVNFPEQIYQAARTPDIVAEAAYLILTSDSREVTGNFFVDEDVLKAHGQHDFHQYAVNPAVQLYPDFFLDE